MVVAVATTNNNASGTWYGTTDITSGATDSSNDITSINTVSATAVTINDTVAAAVATVYVLVITMLWSRPTVQIRGVAHSVRYRYRKNH